jgi:hypothetical protein
MVDLRSGRSRSTGGISHTKNLSVHTLHVELQSFRNGSAHDIFGGQPQI